MIGFPGVERRAQESAASGRSAPGTVVSFLSSLVPVRRSPRRADGRTTARPVRGGDSSGSSLLEAVLVLALLAMLFHGVVPELVVWRQRVRLQAAARLVLLRARRLCAAAVASGRAHAMAFDVTAEGMSWLEVVDGDADGVRRSDLSSGTDPPLGPRRWLSRVHPGVTAGRPAGVGPLPGGSEGRGGLALGRGRMASCAPDGASSTGTIYLKNAVGDAAAVRWYGATARVSAGWRGREDTAWRPLR